MLSLPEDWDYTTKGLAHICKDGVDSITTALKELNGMGISPGSASAMRTDSSAILSTRSTRKACNRRKTRVSPKRENPRQVNPRQAKPEQAEPEQENPAQLNTNPQKLKIKNGYIKDYINQSIRKSRKRQAVRMGWIDG